MKVTPSLPKGTRDFGPAELRKRNYIFGVIRNVFEKYGFQPIETPVMENLSTLEGKYGEEGDKLLFRILNSGDYLKDVSPEDLNSRLSSKISYLISEKGLRYDLTIPFARYVVQHQNEITFPFKRYQIQPVWRADRPQKGRYREFYQCDADVIGSDSLLNEVELILIYDEVFRKLGLDVTIKINHRAFLQEIVKESLHGELTENDLIKILDKIGKAGDEEILKEVEEKFGVGSRVRLIVGHLISDIKSVQTNEALLSKLHKYLTMSDQGLVAENFLREIFKKVSCQNLKFHPTLARGLDYYTGCVFEVSANNIQMGSIGGGGRYDNLTGVFGLPGVSGVGISFGVERIYDVMEELNLFPEILEQNEKVLFVPRDEVVQDFTFNQVQQLRNAEISSEIFLGNVKKQKHFNYAESKRISYIVEVGENEMKSEIFRLRSVKEKKEVLNDSGNAGFTLEQIIQRLKS